MKILNLVSAGMSLALLLSLAAFPLATIFAQTIDYRAKAKELVGKMTLEEKASLASGKDFWTTKPVERLGIPSIFMTDGPHGLRKDSGGGFTNSVPATCFPTASALASSWNTELLEKVGEALGVESQANDVQILLGPGVNMKRSPLGGRNFEYFSEDPVLSGRMAVAFINGVQSQGVGTSLKHFAANNQEYQRMTMSSSPDDRTLHEIYLPAFEMAVTEAQPWTVMCSYNKLNGVYASQNPFLLDEILKKEWGLKGFVVSDWGAVDDRVAGIKAGLNLEMPASGGLNDRKIVEAVKSGQLEEARLDEVITELLAVILKARDAHKSGVTYDAQKHHELARQASGETIVLLKNDNAILPLDTEKTKKIAVIGGFAKHPRYQGSGSSRVNPTQLANAFDELKKLAGNNSQISFAQGYEEEGRTDDKLIAEAVEAAKNSEVAIVFAGLPDSYESEGYDRQHIDLPDGHNRLVEAVAQAQPNIVVVLMNGSAVALPWVSKVKAILEGWLGGQAGGGAIADVLTGRVNPSGKLSETFPVRLADTPAFLDFPARNGEARYGEGIFIGYRYYDKKKIAPRFPFGYGMSYTTFAYSGIKADRTSLKDTDPLTVEVTVKNTGNREGKEVVELYVGDRTGKVLRPEKELKKFAKVSLKPGEEKTVSFKLGFRDFAYYDENVKEWETESGKYEILVGGSSESLPLRQIVEIESTRTAFAKLTPYSTLKELSNHPRGKAAYEQVMGGMSSMFLGGNTHPSEEEKQKARATAETFFGDLPLKKLITFSQGNFTEAMLEGLLQSVNQ